MSRHLTRMSSAGLGIRCRPRGLAKADPILLWDPEDRTLIAANIVGTWLAPAGLARVTVTAPSQ